MDRDPEVESAAERRRWEARSRPGTRSPAANGPRAGVSDSLSGRKSEPLRADRSRDFRPREELDRRPERRGHRREYDGRAPRRSFSSRVDSVVRDVGAFRAVALKDVVERQFDGHPFAARQGIALAERRGWVERREARGPKGGTYTAVVATPAGAAKAAALWRQGDRPGQRTFSGAVKLAELTHDVAVYRAANEAQDRIEAAGGRVKRVRIDAELKGAVAARGERARGPGGAAAAEEQRRRAAAELGLPVQNGRVLVPDAQLEYETAAGAVGRCNIEVASEHYDAREILAKAAAGFELYAASGRAAAVVRRALAGGGGRRGGRGVQEEELFEL